MQSPPLRILCTEDDADTRELVRLVLGYHNCDVVTTETPLEAIKIARVSTFDLYLLDNWIPGMSGPELCRALRRFDTVTPVLFYSGAAYPKDKAEALACGAQGYLVKPAGIYELAAEVLRLIAQSRAGLTRKVQLAAHATA